MSTNPATPKLRPATILGYSINDDVLCPACLRATTPITGVTVEHTCRRASPDAPRCPACEASQRTETREVLPLYYADSALRAERCTYCDKVLLDLALANAGGDTSTFTVEATTFRLIDPTPPRKLRFLPALRFDRPPPASILTALKAAGWRWEPRQRVWVDYSATAEVPEALRSPIKPVPAAPRPPIRRRKAPPEATATVH